MLFHILKKLLTWGLFQLPFLCTKSHHGLGTILTIFIILLDPLGREFCFMMSRNSTGKSQKMRVAWWPGVGAIWRHLLSHVCVSCWLLAGNSASQLLKTPTCGLSICCSLVGCLTSSRHGDWDPRLSILREERERAYSFYALSLEGK